MRLRSLGEQAQAEFYTKYFPSLYKDLQFRSTIFGYTDLLPKLTVAWRAGNLPDVARVAIQWSPQFVGTGQAARNHRGGARHPVQPVPARALC